MVDSLISVIIPVHNCAAYLSECINSVCNQSYHNIEIILIDDGSTDNSLEIARRFENNKVRVVSQLQQGAAAARNHGFSLSKGKYIQFLDADDLLGDGKLKSQVEALQQRPDYIANCRTIHFNGINNPHQNQPSNYEDQFYESTSQTDEFLIKLWGGYSAFGSMVSSHAWLVPRSIVEEVGGWNTALSNDDDGEFFSKVILKAQGICYLPEVFVYYRKQENSSLSTLDSKEKLASLLTSATLKTGYLLQKNDSESAKLASYKIILDIAIKSYKKYPDLYHKALSNLPSLKRNNYLPSLGGPGIQLIGKYLGWKTALFIQYYLKSAVNIT